MDNEDKKRLNLGNIGQGLLRVIFLISFLEKSNLVLHVQICVCLLDHGQTDHQTDDIAE